MNEEEHATYLRVVLKTLKDCYIFAKFSKCEVWLTFFVFLWHILFRERTLVDYEKIELVKQWNRPTFPIDILSFLGLASITRGSGKDFRP